MIPLRPRYAPIRPFDITQGLCLLMAKLVGYEGQADE